MNKITAHIAGDQISSNSKEAINLHASKRFGEKDKDKIVYTFCEALYLLEEDQLEILDLKDKKILKCLEENSRQSHNQIAKKAGLSKESVRYRIKQLEEKGIIQNYKVVVDIKKLDYRAYHLFVNLNKPDLEIEKEYLKKLISYPFVRAVIKFSGGYDFEIAMVAKNIDELERNLTQLFNGVDKYIKENELLIVVRTFVGRVFPKSFLEFEIEKKKKKIKEIKVDDKDIKILNVLKEDAVMPIYKIAEKTKLGVDSVTYRMKKLEDGEIIRNYIPAINYRAVGYQVYAILLRINSLYEDVEAKLKRYLIQDPNVLWAVKTIGNYNVMIYLAVDKPEDLHDTLNKIRRTFANRIKGYKTLIAYEEYKYTYFPELFLGE